ncbi:MAG: WbqC family protein, partial [Bacteroidia bacterium]|nr:WbqC family protein [Bacteroidia bacterium]
DYAQNWQKIHFRSIESAYRHSPFYEFLIDEFRFLWEIRLEYLFEYNMIAMQAVLKLMKSDVAVRLTQDFQEPGYYGPFDYRYSIHPKAKKQGTGYVPVPYHQVFADRFGYIQDLSILDWLFNDFRI